VPGVGADDDVLQRRHLPPQPNVLERPRNPQPGDLVAFQPAQWLTVEHNRAGAGSVHPGDRVEAGGLAGTVGADQAQDLAAVDREAHRVQRGQPAEADTEVAGLQ